MCGAVGYHNVWFCMALCGLVYCGGAGYSVMWLCDVLFGVVL